MNNQPGVRLKVKSVLTIKQLRFVRNSFQI